MHDCCWLWSVGSELPRAYQGGQTQGPDLRCKRKGSNKTANALPSIEQTAELEAERRKRIQLEQELAALRALKEQQQANVEADNQVPFIDIFSLDTTGKQGIVKGRVSDNTGVAEVVVDGKVSL